MNYLGGKTILSKYLAPIIQSFINYDTSWYVEPFVGGCGMMSKVSFLKRRGYDIDKHVIGFWNDYIYNDWEPPKRVSRWMYRELKNNQHRYPDALVALYKYGLSFRGKAWGRYSGKIIHIDRRVYPPRRRKRCFLSGFKTSCKKKREGLYGCFFETRDYRSISRLKNAVIYCDPPYISSKERNKDYYSTSFDHSIFFKWCTGMAKENTVLVSDRIVPEGLSLEVIFEKDRANNMMGMRVGEKKQRVSEYMYRVNPY